MPTPSFRRLENLTDRLAVCEKALAEAHAETATGARLTANVTDRLNDMEHERDEALAKYQWMVDRQADEKLGDYLELGARVVQAERERDKLQAWVHDLQSGMFVNCVYCGHRYGPDPGTEVTMADVLHKHIESCPKHPFSKERTLRESVEKERDARRIQLDRITEEVASWAEAGFVELRVADTFDAGMTLGDGWLPDETVALELATAWVRKMGAETTEVAR